MRLWDAFGVLLMRLVASPVAMHGAALLYNVLLAERAEKLGLSQYEGHRDDFADLLEDWRGEVGARQFWEAGI